LRREAERSQQEVALRLGVPQSFVSKYESGERHLDPLELRQICAALEVPMEVFWKRFETMLSEMR
jgi:transcriptional regulator with XRE-family HTH domain